VSVSSTCVITDDRALLQKLIDWLVKQQNDEQKPTTVFVMEGDIEQQLAAARALLREAGGAGVSDDMLNELRVLGQSSKVKLLLEAADEIVRLRKELAAARLRIDELESRPVKNMRQIVREFSND